MRVRVQFRSVEPGSDAAVLHQGLMRARRTSNDLPTTAYLVLGVLAANDEQLTAGEIKTPRRVLGRTLLLVAVGQPCAARTRPTAGPGDGQRDRRPGRKARHHALRGDGGRARGSPPVGAALPRPRPGRHQASGHPQDMACPRRGSRARRRHVRPSPRDDAGAAGRGTVGRQRSRDLGITEDPDQRFSFAVLDYAIRGLYAEMSNIEQLRDEIARGTPKTR